MSNWGLSKKIWAILGLLVVAFVGSSYFNLSRMNQIRDALEEITTVNVKRNQLTSRLSENQRGLTITSLEIILETDEAKMKGVLDRFNTGLESQQELLKAYKEIASPEGLEFAKTYEGVFEKYMGALKKSQEYALKNENKEAWQTYSDGDAQRSELRDLLKSMNDLTMKVLDAKTKDANTMADQAIRISVMIAVISILASLVIAWFTLRAVTGSVQRVVENLFEGSMQVTSASGQIASASEELSQSASEQAAALEQTAASIQEMNSMVAKNSENADRTARTSEDSKKQALHGKEVVEKMKESMDAINHSNDAIVTQINHSNDQFAAIAKVIEDIGNKTKVINDIVFQTKLLSFNASVEAARAGEHGKGYAVVAEEVGNLAQMSGNAAKEISSMLEGSIQRVHSIVTETNQTVSKLVDEGKKTVDNGTAVALECGEVLEQIVQNIGEVSNMAHEIAQASQEQARGMTEISRAMDQLDSVTQQNAGSSEEAASAAAQLSGQADAMKGAVEQLSHVIQGGSGASATRGAPTHAASSHRPGHRSGTAAAPKRGGEVVRMSDRKAAHEPSRSASLKKASGDSMIPSSDDPNFKDI